MTRRIALGPRAQVQQQRRVAAVVEDHVGVAAVRPLEDAVRVVPVVRRASRPSRRTPACRARRWRRRRGPGSRRCCTRPSAPRAPSACSVSISTAVWMVMCSEPAMRAPCSGCVRAILLADRHEAGHLGLGDRDFLAAPVGEREIRDLVVALAGGRFQRGVHTRYSECQSERRMMTRPAEPGGRSASRPARRNAPQQRGCRRCGCDVSSGGAHPLGLGGELSRPDRCAPR